MPDASTRVLTIELPASVKWAGAPDVLALAIVDDSQIQGGKQAITRSYIDANTDGMEQIKPRIKRVEWNPWGPIGASLQSSANGLSTDFTQDMETRWPRRLISSGKVNTLDLTKIEYSDHDVSKFARETLRLP